jgi:WD40 repeat protein
MRLWKPKGASDFTNESIGEADVRGTGIDRAAFSPSGSFLATSFLSTTGDELISRLALYEIESMTKTQSAVMPGFIVACVALSPDSKKLVYGDIKGRIQLLQTDDFSIQRGLDTAAEAKEVCTVAFDPTCSVLAFGCDDGRLELRSLQTPRERSAIYQELSVAHGDY